MKKLVMLTLISVMIVQCSGNRLKRSSGRGSTPAQTDSDGNPVDGSGRPGTPGSVKPGLPQAGKTLVWKRYRPFESGLVKGLGLTKDQVCLELGKDSCIDKVHLTVLGGNEPFINGQYERAQTPTVLTAVAIDRVVLAACSRRIELDAGLGANAVVFKHFPLTAAKPSDDQIKQQATELYRRLLARDPEAPELQAISAFGGTATAGDKIALSLCYAIASSSENIFL
ncbi:MAG TPA: hypothetical protein VFO10_23095 [Oligoflexus sp.]|uniref:hypothetical protein n=1 Tax=Oligoflexus sp. TaxID=1971216 RepID=UPI002D7EEC7B|nr:hypothetical protein [Oligoflexus sp.]HET9240169.1 hypothetical protein [Oligoflexus sp.]